VKLRARGVSVALALAAFFAVSVGAAAPEEEEVPRCHGRRAKIVGTDGPDVIHGTTSRDVIWAGLGDDVVYGELGNDLICGGPGADVLHGGRGNDDVDGGAGERDIAIGELGDDKVTGGPGSMDEVAGSLGIDVVNGGPGREDLVHGDYGWDRMSGGAGGGDIASFATDVAAGKGGGDWVSLAKHRAYGDGHDKLFGFESLEGSAFADTLIGTKGANVIDGGPGDDHIFGDGGPDLLEGGQGTDGCKGGAGHLSCGPERAPTGSAYVQVDSTPGGGGGLQIVGGAGDDDFTVAFDPAAQAFALTAGKGVAVGHGCMHPDPRSLNTVACRTRGPGRWLTADLGPGNDRFRVEGSLAAVENVRVAGGLGQDIIRGGPESDLFEAGPGGGRLYGEGGADGLVGGLPGPVFIYGGEGGDLMAAGGGCAGGALVGGPGRDDASFAETQAHPGILHISFAVHSAWIDVVKGCHHVHLSPTDEDMEGSFDYDVLVGDGGPNAMLGQPGEDSFYGGGGEDVIDARDGVRDGTIRCGPRPGSGRAITDPFDPPAEDCAIERHGHPVPGLNG
jgi:Ca2+-binding RTX toxin-like protein